MTRVLIVLGILAALQPSIADAHDIKISSASGLLANCTYQSDEQTEIEFHTGFCLGFLKAIMNTHPTFGETFCIPAQTTDGDLLQVVRNRLYRLAPEMLQAPSHIVVGAIYQTAYPCSRK